jgi:gas vesicle protein
MFEYTAEESHQSGSNAGSSIAWFCVGVVVGAAAAILYAPQSGKETREMISKKTQEGKEAVESTADAILEQGRDILEKGRSMVDDTSDLFERGRKLVHG